MSLVDVVSAIWRDPGRVVWAYAFVTGLQIVLVAGLPGEPFYADEGQGTIGAAIFVWCLIVLGLAYRSRIAWFGGMFFSAGGVALGIVGLLDLQWKFMLVGSVELVGALLLLSPAMDQRVWRRPAAAQAT